MRKKVLILLFFGSFSAFSAKERGGGKSHIISLGALVFFQSQTVEKGALIWPGASLLPVVALNLFDQLSIRGLGLVWEPLKNNAQHHLEFSLYRFDDGAPWIKLTRAQESYRNQRRAVWETFAEYRYKFGYRNSFYAGLKFAQAISQYEDVYTEGQLGAPVLPYTQLQLAVAFMPQRTIEYYYGQGAVAGVSHFDVGIVNFYPKLPWNGVLINKLNFSYIPVEKNQKALYIRGQKENFSWKTILSWKLL